MKFRAQARRARATVARERVARRRRWTAVAACSLVVTLPARLALGQGFGLNEIGSCAIARGFAATSAPCDDASTIYWNPGAATSLKGLSFYGGASAIKVNGKFTADTTGKEYPSDVPTAFPPFLGGNWTAASHRYAIGLAAYVPYGLTSQWKQDFVGRFTAQKASLQSIYVQPNVAIELVPGKFSVGGGPVFAWSQLELHQSLDFSQQIVPNPALPANTTFASLGFAPGTEFGRANLKGSATSWGYNLGAQWKPAPTVSLGARYVGKVHFKYDDADATFEQVSTGLTLYPGSPLLPAGSPAVPLDQVIAANFASGGKLVAQKVSTVLDFPAQFQVGIAYTGFPRTTLSADYALVQYTSFKELPVNFLGAAQSSSRVLLEEYKNSNGVRLGLDHKFGQSALSGLLADVSGRLGFAYAGTPAPDVTVTPLLPDMNRYNFMGGLGIPLGDVLTLDATYLRVETEGRRGRVIERASASQTAAQLNGGWYSLNANIFSLSLKAQF